MTGRGLGTALIREFGKKYIFTNSDITAIIADPATTNLRSISSFKKAGFESVRTVRLAGEAFDRLVVCWNR